MEWLNNFNKAINYIEEHLMDEIHMNRIAQIAGCSAFHFQRMFSYMADLTLSEYIRRRKMTRAAFDLQNGNEKIIDIALRYGYDSPTAFNRAFQGVHGIAPSAARGEKTMLKAYPPISFKMKIKGEAEMNYRIEKKEAFRVVGISQPLEKELEKNFETVPLMWGKAAQDGTIEKLVALMNSQPMGLLGVSACNDEEDWRYFIAVASTEKIDSNFEEYTVPPATWAIFPGEGINTSIQELEKRIITEWLPSSGYEYADAPDIEVYLNPDPANAKYEVWLPIRKQHE